MFTFQGGAAMSSSIRMLALTFLYFLFVILFASVAGARTWHINPDGTGEAPTVQAGIDSAAAGDTVLLANGTYTGEGNRDMDFLGKPITVRSAGGDPDSCRIDAESHQGFVFQTEEDSTSVLRGVTIGWGLAHSYPNNGGGALRMTAGSSPLIMDCVFDHCGGERGGAVYCEFASPRLVGCRFTSDWADCGGAGFFCISSSPVLLECSFSEVYSDAFAEEGGGAVCCIDCPDVVLTSCTVEVHSSSSEDGGALFFRNSDVSMVDCDISQGYAWLNGGGLAAKGGSYVSMEDCRFSWNSADSGGGALYLLEASTVAAVRCDFTSNATGGPGGVVLSNSSSGSFQDCRFVGNAGCDGGAAYWIDSDFTLEGCLFSRTDDMYEFCGLHFVDSSPSILGCTFYGYRGAYLEFGSEIYCEGSSHPVIESSIIAFGQGHAAECEPGSDLTAICCDIYGNEGGDWVGCLEYQLGQQGNLSEDPVFCDAENDDLQPASDSPCLNGPCGQIGAFGQGCLGERPRITSIEDVGNDQGKQVRIGWQRSRHDSPADSIGMPDYEIYRREDQYLRVDGLGAAEEPGPRLEGWDYIGTVPAHGDSIYQVVAPTLCDSTLAHGMCWSVFFVRGVTPDPFEYFDSPPDSGYSVDNLAPAPPENFLWVYPAGLRWDGSPEEDFNYFAVYGSQSSQPDESAVLIDYTTGTSLDVSGSLFPHYFVTATDFAGNEGDPAWLDTPAEVGPEGSLPGTFALHPVSPNPFSGATTLSFDLPEARDVELLVFDARGRRVAVVVDGPMDAGRYRMAWSDPGLVPGVYFARLRAGAFEARERFVVLR